MAITETFCGVAQVVVSVPETGAMPAIGNFASHAILYDMSAPLDIPVKKIRRGSTPCSVSICETMSDKNFTSSVGLVSPALQRRLTACG
jgi:hypothetical protein